MDSRLRMRAFLWATVTTCTIGMALGLIPASAGAGDTLARVKSRQVLRCGVSEGLIGFSLKDPAGEWTGLDVDFCRAVAAAVGDRVKVQFVPLFASARFPALQADEIDLLVRNTTWTLGREAFLGVQFAGILFYDGQGFMVPRKGKVRRIAELKGATICVDKGTTSEQNLVDYFRARGWNYKPLVLESVAEIRDAFVSGRCQAYTSDASQLASMRMAVPDGTKKYIILPDLISKEPLGPVVRRGDEEWFTLVRWVLFALIQAEELGVTRENVRTLKETSTDPAVQRLLGKAGGFGKALGVDNDWVVRVVGTVGNYGEMFERNLGRESVLNLERGLNRLWKQGGLMYAPPFR
ncbi:MAG TPA: amino acid ABC transporter substrate-binding protein [Syntrophobacteria bacterium]|nr:amino acid ABC transporter substrate-binding protein [Syntrophobacteria bacterium]